MYHTRYYLDLGVLLGKKGGTYDLLIIIWQEVHKKSTRKLIPQILVPAINIPNVLMEHMLGIHSSLSWCLIGLSAKEVGSNGWFQTNNCMYRPTSSGPGSQQGNNKERLGIRCRKGHFFCCVYIHLNLNKSCLLF